MTQPAVPPPAVAPAAPAPAPAPKPFGPAPKLPPARMPTLAAVVEGAPVLDPAAPPVVPEAPATKRPTFEQAVRAQSRALAQQRAAKEQQAGLAIEQRRLAQERQQIQAERELAKSKPAEWMQANMTAEQIQAYFKNGGKPTTDMELAELRARVEKGEREAEQRQLAQQRQQFEANVQQQAAGFTTWVQTQEKDFPALASWPEVDTQLAWRGVQQRAAAAGQTYSRREIAKFLDSQVKPLLTKAVERFGSIAKLPPREDALAPAATTAAAPANGGAPRTLGSLSTEIASTAVPLHKLSKKEQIARMADEYRRTRRQTP
jgi:hypothetical protein